MPTALLSVYDKTGVADLAHALHELGWTLVSSGGTAGAIAAAGVPVTDVAELTGFPAILGHRVVTLHPKVHGGLLADVSDPEHLADLERYGIEPIQLVVVNLYPFTSKPGIELIDVGGPTMVRAAAKNNAHVGIVVDPAQYPAIVEELSANGSLTDATKRRLARDAFAHTAAYDAAIVTWFDETAAEPEALPRSMHLALDLVQTVRYGENPHQQGARYRIAGRRSWWDEAEQLNGKELSYLNLYDTEAAWRLVHRLERPGCVIVKHANPCGVAIAPSLLEAYRKAFKTDPVSAFGGILAFNRALDRAVDVMKRHGVSRAVAGAAVDFLPFVPRGPALDALVPLLASTKDGSFMWPCMRLLVRSNDPGALFSAKDAFVRHGMPELTSNWILGRALQRVGDDAGARPILEKVYEEAKRLAEEALANRTAVDPGQRAQHADNQRLGGHFQAEPPHRQPQVRRAFGIGGPPVVLFYFASPAGAAVGRASSCRNWFCYTGHADRYCNKNECNTLRRA